MGWLFGATEAPVVPVTSLGTATSLTALLSLAYLVFDAIWNNLLIGSLIEQDINKLRKLSAEGAGEQELTYKIRELAGQADRIVSRLIFDIKKDTQDNSIINWNTSLGTIIRALGEVAKRYYFESTRNFLIELLQREAKEIRKIKDETLLRISDDVRSKIEKTVLVTLDATNHATSRSWDFNGKRKHRWPRELLDAVYDVLDAGIKIRSAKIIRKACTTVTYLWDWMRPLADERKKRFREMLPDSARKLSADLAESATQSILGIREKIGDEFEDKNFTKFIRKLGPTRCKRKFDVPEGYKGRGRKLYRHLIKLLDEQTVKNAQVRGSAADALGEIQISEPGDFCVESERERLLELIKATGDPEQPVPQKAAISIKEVYQEFARLQRQHQDINIPTDLPLEVLAKRLQDLGARDDREDTQEIRSKIAQALAEIAKHRFFGEDEEKVTKILREVALNEADYTDVRERALRALQHFRDVEPMIVVARDTKVFTVVNRALDGIRTWIESLSSYSELIDQIEKDILGNKNVRERWEGSDKKIENLFRKIKTAIERLRKAQTVSSSSQPETMPNERFHAPGQQTGAH